MYRSPSKAYIHGAAALLAAVASVGTATWLSSEAQSQSKNHEVTITIERVTAVDRSDAASRPDYFARVVIDGDSQMTPAEMNKTDISPNWKISKMVPAGRTQVKVEILDKDVQINDPVDINRLPNKRDLDFTVDTRNCRIVGFADGYSCGSKIVRAGDQRKAAEITFSVSVKK